MSARSLFKNATIRKKMMLLFLIATIVPIAASIAISYHETRSSITKEAITKNNRLLSLGSANIVNYMNNINQKSLAVYNSMNVPRSLYYLLEHNLEDESFPNGISDVIENRNLLKDHLYNIYQSMKEFYKIRLYVAAQNTSYLLWNDDIKVGKHEPNTIAMAPKTYIEPTHISHNYGLPIKSPVEEEPVFSLHRPIFLAPSDKQLAELTIDVKTSVLSDLNSQLYDAGNENFYVVDQSGALILSSKPDYVGQRLDDGWFRTAAGAGAEQGHFKWDHDGFKGMIFYQQVSTPYMNWFLIKQTPDSHLYAAANKTAWLNMWVGAAFLGVAVIATLIISFRFTKPLLALIGYVNKIDSGNLGVQIDIQSNDEIGLLAKRFRSMMQTINNLILKEYRLELANKTIQLKALQAQVNPHFLYNALQSVGTVALQQGNKEVYGLVTSLGKMMRYQMNMADAEVTLSQELDYVQAYLDLQKERFDKSLDVILMIDERTRDIRMPKMIVQPLVENFFKHGFSPSERPAQLVIASSLGEDGSLTIVVSDNGCGMPAEKLAGLNAAIQEEDRPDGAVGSDNGIGLRNILSRLRLSFGPDASLSVQQLHPHGFSVTLHIPHAKEEKEA
ncbi:cache domain-containing sensor histidine kinase [Paenibacillus sacheonensis]|uniref:HAMP domain-containing protein n=1 Tax=Paenibacillus sacheonensis TaxID=742054 RepID=A0A7X5BVT6_9BACL|nr:sensor histidine kinase [Paenibacillus sacheonensis]MBM7565999.1 two-component system sensor histidine kinase YesM [Paenibacillus sacheonensis]NBC68688.1 HAMP domain-containing protein [Paenibacillus sacheonensis]